MSTETNKALTVKIFEALSNNDFDFIKSVYADEAKVWVAGNTPISGTYAGKEFLEMLGQGNDQIFPNGIRVEVRAMTAEGNRVAAELESNADHASGKKYNNFYHVLLVFKDGIVQEYKEYMDTAHVADVFYGE